MKIKTINNVVYSSGRIVGSTINGKVIMTITVANQTMDSLGNQKMEVGFNLSNESDEVFKSGVFREELDSSEKINGMYLLIKDNLATFETKTHRFENEIIEGAKLQLMDIFSLTYSEIENVI